MALTDTAIRTAKPRAKPYKLADERGMFLLVQPSGGRLWRLKYRVGGKEKKLALGVYPDTGLKEAREKREAARKLLAEGIDPGLARQQAQTAQAISSATTFKAVADEFIAKITNEGRSAGTVDQARWFLKLLEASIGARPVADITPQELLAPLKKVEQRGRLETAKRMRSFAGRVFRFAIGSCPTAWCNCGDVVTALSGGSGLIRRPRRAG